MADCSKQPTLTHSGSRKLLRRLELEAYASVVSAFRAQGHLSREKRTSLEHLSKCLGISPERHRAEIRRAVNDDVLSQVADSISGVDTEKAWRREGQKLLSGLPPRLVSHSHPPVLPQALTAITAATHTFGPTPGTSSSTGGSASTEASRKVPTPIQNALRVILSSVSSKTEQASNPGGGKPSKATSRGVQKNQSGGVGAVKEETDGAGTRSSPSRSAVPDAGKIYSQLESLLCEEQLNLSKGSGDESDDKDKMVTDTDEKGDKNSASGSPSRPPQTKAGQDSIPKTAQTGVDKVKASQEAGTNEGGESGDGLSDAGKTISDLISRISRKRQLSPVQASDQPPAKKKAVQSSPADATGSVKSRVTVSPLVSRSTASSSGKVVAVSTPSVSKAQVQGSVKTSPATSRAISILRAVATSKTAANSKTAASNKAAATSNKGTSTLSAKIPLGSSKVSSPAKSQASSSGVQVIPISSQTDPAFSQAIETLNKALSSLNKAGISSLSAVSPAAAALISRKRSPLRSLSPSHRPQTNTAASMRISSSKEDVQKIPQSSSSSTAQSSQGHVVVQQSQGSLSSSSQQTQEQFPPVSIQAPDPVFPKPQKSLTPAIKRADPLHQHPSKTSPQQQSREHVVLPAKETLPSTVQQSQEHVVQPAKGTLPSAFQQPQEQPVLPESGGMEPAAPMDQASNIQAQLVPSHRQQEMLSIAARLVQEVFPSLSQATVSKSEVVSALSQSGQQLNTATPGTSVTMASQQAGNVEGVASRPVSKAQEHSLVPVQGPALSQSPPKIPSQVEPVPSQTSQNLIPMEKSDLLCQDKVLQKEPVLPQPSHELLPSQDPVSLREPVLSQSSQKVVLTQESVPSHPSQRLPQQSQEPSVSQPHQLPATSLPQQVVLPTSEQKKELYSVPSSLSQQYSHSVGSYQPPNQGDVQSPQNSASTAQQLIPVVSTQLPSRTSTTLSESSTSSLPLPIASSQPCLQQSLAKNVSQQITIVSQSNSTAFESSHSSSPVLPSLPSVPSCPSDVRSLEQTSMTVSDPVKLQQQKQMVVPPTSFPLPAPAQVEGNNAAQTPSNEPQPMGPEHVSLPLSKPSDPISVPLQPLLTAAPQAAELQGSSMLEDKLPAGVDSSESLNISDLIQDTSDSTVSSLASQLAGLENAIPLLNMDFMAFLQPTTPDSPVDALPVFPSTPELPNIESVPSLPGSTRSRSSLSDSPMVSTPLVLGRSPLAQGLDDTSLSKAMPTPESSESVLEISTLATSKDMSGDAVSTNQSNPGNSVPSSSPEYLDLDINSLMDPSKLLEGIPEDMAKSIQTIVQLDEETWK